MIAERAETTDAMLQRRRCKLCIQQAPVISSVADGSCCCCCGELSIGEIAHLSASSSDPGERRAVGAARYNIADLGSG